MSAIFAGSILAFAFAPHNYWLLALISPLILLLVLRQASARQAFWLGMLYGLSSYTVGVYWLKQAVAEFANLPSILSTVVAAAIIVIQASFVAGQGYILRRFFSQNTRITLLLVFPSLWVISEWLRSWMFTGFPWLILGYSQLDTVLKNFAPIISVYGISWLLVFMAALCTINSRMIAVSMIVTIWLLGFGLGFVEWTNIDYSPHSVSIIQPNIAARDKIKLSPQQHNDFYRAATLRSIDSELIIWPEQSIPWTIPQAQDFLDHLDVFAKEHNSSLIVGALQASGDRFYNSLIAVGAGTGVYHKQHLIPFAEYLPFDQAAAKIFKKLNLKYPILKLGPKQQDSLHLPVGNLLPLICYEVAYAENVRANLQANAATAIVNISEDGWFGNTWATAQHMAIARMRALETGRYLLRSSTSGISAVVDEKGNIVAKSEKFMQQTVKAIFYNATGVTPWMRLGMNWLIGLMFACIFFVRFYPQEDYS